MSPALSLRRYLAVLLFKIPDAVADEDEHLTVCRTALVIRDNMQLVEHGVIKTSKYVREAWICRIMKSSIIYSSTR